MPANPILPRTETGRHLSRITDLIARYGVELCLLAMLVYLCTARGLAIHIDVQEAEKTGDLSAAVEQFPTPLMTSWLGDLKAFARGRLATVREVSAVVNLDDTDGATDTFNSVAVSDDPAPHISNLTLVLSPDYGERKGLPAHIISAKKQRVADYLTRYAPAARREMRDHGIPASITLAQALLESNAGDSKLAVNSNNHFGIKCRSKCLGCTCRNYGDDTRYDMFRVFDSPAESFAEHSRLLNTRRYAKLKSHGTDYVKWAHGLKACGYATDKRYGYKLVKIIENLKLDRYDEESP